ncbi:FixH family protein [Bradyrhizobium sp. 2TAF24]|uniref:FixH family protein n=1 Tax=Bradyrhizobium sp. 2TAF24 TaxID=3233011 RepID=UPI003F8DFF0F
MSRSTSPSISPPAPARPLTGRVVLVMVVAFFAVIISVNVVMMTLAVKTLPGTEVDSAYRASLAYGGEIKAAEAQAQRQWRVGAHVAREADGGAALQVEALDRDGAPLDGIAFSSRLERPADQNGDRVVVLTGIGQGRYRGRVADVGPGQWDLVIEGERAGERVFLSRNRVVLN